MAIQDPERNAIYIEHAAHTPDPASRLSESLEASSERASLLPPEFDGALLNYKSTEVATAEESTYQDGECLDDEDRVSKSALAVISLFLIGICIHPSFQLVC